MDDTKSPLDNVYDEELRARVEMELKAVVEPYRTTVILRDIEELSYEQIAEVTGGFVGHSEVTSDAGSRCTAKKIGTPPPGIWRKCGRCAPEETSQGPSSQRPGSRGHAMKCSDAMPLMSSYLDAAVTRSEMTAIQEHIDSCAVCSARFPSATAHPDDGRRVGPQACASRPGAENTSRCLPAVSQRTAVALGNDARPLGECIQRRDGSSHGWVGDDHHHLWPADQFSDARSVCRAQ